MLISLVAAFHPLRTLATWRMIDGVKPLIALVLAAAQSPASATPPHLIGGMECFHEGSAVRLTGTVAFRMFYGAPNYGESPKTDRRVRVPILQLDRPITPCELTEFDRIGRKLGEPVREVQIDFGPAKMKAGERRTLLGKIHPAEIAPDFLDYVLWVG